MIALVQKVAEANARLTAASLTKRSPIIKSARRRQAIEDRRRDARPHDRRGDLAFLTSASRLQLIVAAGSVR